MHKQKKKRSCPKGAFQSSFLIFPAIFLSRCFLSPVFCTGFLSLAFLFAHFFLWLPFFLFSLNAFERFFKAAGQGITPAMVGKIIGNELIGAFFG